jgi:hypothetical protein
MIDLDPSLCFDTSEYGHLGYDPDLGPPDPDNPVQDQYTGTWEVYVPPNADPRVGQMLANYVLQAAVDPMVYITNGEVEGINSDENVTFEAHVTGGGVLPYTYEWAIKQEEAPKWKTVRGNSTAWTWNPASWDAGIYDVRCRVTDSQNHSGEVIWEGFVINSSCPVLQIYGEDSEQTERLRYFRDTILNQTLAGREIIRLYYQFSPAIVEVMKADKAFKTDLKKMINEFLPLIGGALE